jgi:hypothetical protein
MHAQSFFMAVTPRIDVKMKVITSELAVHQLYATDLDKAVALVGVQAGRLCIQKNLSHVG